MLVSNKSRLLRKMLMLGVLVCGLYVLTTSNSMQTASAKICQQTCEASYQYCLSNALSTCGSGNEACQSALIDDCEDAYLDCSDQAEWCDSPYEQHPCTHDDIPSGNCCFVRNIHNVCDVWDSQGNCIHTVPVYWVDYQCN